MSGERTKVLVDSVLAGGPVVLAAGALMEGEWRSTREREIERRALERGRAEGQRQGREAGLGEGRKAAEAEFRSAAQALAQAMGGLAAERRRVLADAKDAVLRLALAVARKVIHGEVRHNADAAARVIDAALERAGGAATVRVRLSPQDLERLAQAPGLPGPGEPAAGLPRVDLVADPAISPGGCVVETECGAVDATVETQWGEVQAALEGAAAQILAGEREGVGA